LTLEIIPTPPRNRRILWDQFHNLKFPESGYILRDSLSTFQHPYDWYGDSPYINFNLLFEVIRKEGYFLEILRGSFECYNTKNYGILLLVDPEEKFTPDEISKIQKDLVLEGMSLIIFADWYDPKLTGLQNYHDPMKDKRDIVISGYNLMFGILIPFL
jgi:membrane-bound transcription factor site-1 protease